MLEQVNVALSGIKNIDLTNKSIRILAESFPFDLTYLLRKP